MWGNSKGRGCVPSRNGPGPASCSSLVSLRVRYAPCVTRVQGKETQCRDDGRERGERRSKRRPP
eukprot:scaffold4349_cov258-Pinguiococcus_pyrenoidosus.AAC.6